MIFDSLLTEIPFDVGALMPAIQAETTAHHEDTKSTKDTKKNARDGRLA